MFQHRVLRLVFWVTAAAFAGAAALTAAYALRPGFTLEMDREMPGTVSGFHAGERAGQETFAWSRRQVTMQLPNLDRRGAWTCTVRLRGGRAAPDTLPEVLLAVDGIVKTRLQTTNDFSDVRLPLEPRSGSGAVLTLTTSTFVPGAGDPRELGVYVDRWTCGPDAGFVPLPPGPAILTAAIAAAAFGGALALMSAPAVVAGAAVAAIAGVQAVVLVKDLGPFTEFAIPVDWLAGVLALMLWATLLVSRRALGRPISAAGQFALFVTVAVLYLKLITLVHPSKLIVDALFHAHRLEWVLDGRYYFTQIMPSGVRFPYAIGLYVFAAPWTVLTSDYVSLLRVIVTAAEAAGGLLLYVLITRTWGDRAVAAAATVLYSLVPRTFEIVGNANMTNAFGQSVALATLVAVTLCPLSRDRWKTWTGLTVLAAFAMLCHVSTFTLLAAILGTLATLYWWASRTALRSEARMIGAVLVCAAVLATAVYYGHFADAYRSAARVRATPSAVTSSSTVPSIPLTTRISDAARLSVQAVGWPMVVLAVPGVMAWRSRGLQDRLGLAIAALAITFGLLTLSVVVAPVEQSFHRYAVEFLSRVTLATYPAMVIWAALGAVWAWRAGGIARIGGAVLMAAALAGAGDAWFGWIR